MDIGPLRDLTLLEYVGLRQNYDLADVQPLIDNPGVSSGDRVDLYYTAVPCSQVSTLRDDGVTVLSP